jgi:histidine triad (HIT) family protein
MALSQEELSKMSPEETRELQKQQCIFCQIISGKIQSRRIYEDEHVLAILDINPANPGHILLLPKEHCAIMPQMPDAEVSYIMMVAKHLSQALISAFNVKGTNIFIANGAAAGQKAGHFMLHIIPRMPGDGISVFNLPSKESSPREISEAQKILSAKISDVMGMKISKLINLDDKPQQIIAEKKSKADLDRISENLEKNTGGF